METNSTDFNTKYQKLASEYSKIRAQVSVLKKAVVDEQTKGTEFKDSLKEKDQSIRKYKQEIESLTFRNQQLSRRVSVLQDDFEAILGANQSKAKKIKHKNNDSLPSVNISNIVIGEELQSKIEENAQLHKQVYESEQEHSKVISEISSQLESTRQEAVRYKQVLDTIQDQNKAVVDKLRNDKAQLEVCLQGQEKDLKEARLKAEECEEKLNVVQTNLETKLNDATDSLAEHLAFNDTKLPDLNVLNVPVHDRQRQALLAELVEQIRNLIRDLVTGLSNFHTYLEQRVAAVSEDITDDRPLKHINKKLAQFLHENTAYLRPLERSFFAFARQLQGEPFFALESGIGLQDFAEAFGRYIAYLNKLLPYHLLSIEDECLLLSCTPNLEAKNMQFHASMSKVTIAFNQINTYVSALAAQGTQTTQSHVSQACLIRHLSESVFRLHLTIKDASSNYNAKVSLEHQLPTVSQKLRTTDECVLSSMISLVTCTNKLSLVMKEKLPGVLEVPAYRKRCSNQKLVQLHYNPAVVPAVCRFQQRATNYLLNLETDVPESVPYQEALKNREILLSSTESRESLARQLATSQEKISKLEQAKEHWMLEFQLLQIKHEKEVKKLQKLEDQLRSGGDAISTISSSSSADDVTPPISVADLSSGSSSTTSLLGKLDVLGIQFLQSDSRESEVKSYFLNHVKELVQQMQLADSKATFFHAELCTLQKRLQLSDSSRAIMMEQLTEANRTTEALKEELQTTTSNYEAQLRTMSEHLANMNDKLTVQKDEIDALKYQLANWGSKKNKGK